jgi:hypothetical protein
MIIKVPSVSRPNFTLDMVNYVVLRQKSVQFGSERSGLAHLAKAERLSGAKSSRWNDELRIL